MNYKTKGRTVFNIFNYIILVCAALICLLPFVNLFAVSLSGNSAVAAGRVYFWPVEFTLQSYLFALQGDHFLRALWVSCQRVIIGVSVNLLLMILVAYPLSKNKSQLIGRNIYMGMFVVTMLINGGLVPTFLVVTNLGLMNSIWALILPGALPVFSMLILMNFIRSMPGELEEAALVDGAGPLGALIYIVLPLMKPALATVGLFAIVTHWNEWFSGMIYMQNPNNYPLQTYLQTLITRFEQLMRLAGADFTKLLRVMNVRTGRAAQIFLAAIPVMLIYPFLQKYFVTGLVIGSVKG